MSLKTRSYQLEKDITLCDASHASHTFQVSSLSLSKQEEQIIECRLILKVSLETYQQIENAKLFNLKLEVRGPLSNGNFLPEPEIYLELTLKPDLFSSFPQSATTPKRVADYLVKLSREQKESPQIREHEAVTILNTESWFCLSVKQAQTSGETGYTTFWHYVNPATMSTEEETSDNIANGITTFFTQWTEANLAKATKDATADFFAGIGDVLQELLDETWLEDDQGVVPAASIRAAVINFFEEDDWPFVEMEPGSVFSLSCQGEHGRWKCLAKVKEEQQQFIFYSLCPVAAPAEKILAIAEFITRANYGMVIGNFELDFRDGEVRYKTSIDVEGGELSPALIKNLVYTNVTMMDEYLPGIAAVIAGETSLEEAIAQVEEN